MSIEPRPSFVDECAIAALPGVIAWLTGKTGPNEAGIAAAGYSSVYHAAAMQSYLFAMEMQKIKSLREQR